MGILCDLSGLFGDSNGAGRERRKGDMRREQMMEKRAERLADELELKGDARSEFLVTYKNYQQDLMSHRKTPPFPADLEGKKESELTEEEAAERIKAEFDRKAQQIVDAYNTLEVDKKYYEVFSKTMSAKQLMKIFVPVRKMNVRNGGRQGIGRGWSSSARKLKMVFPQK